MLTHLVIVLCHHHPNQEQTIAMQTCMITHYSYRHSTTHRTLPCVINGTTFRASPSPSYSTQARVSNNRDLCYVGGELRVVPLIASQLLELSLKGHIEVKHKGQSYVHRRFYSCVVCLSCAEIY